MPLLTLAELLKPSVRQGWAVGAYDLPDLSVGMGILDAAAADNAPVILLIYPTMTAPDSYPTYAAFLKMKSNAAARPPRLSWTMDPACRRSKPPFEPGLPA
jgi:fructose/tagatose bisphosphate aldolase